MKRNDVIAILILIAIALILYHPVFYSEYAYTDELVQLWLYRKGSGYNMFMPLGRNITDWLFSRLFSSIDTVAEIARLRTFSLIGWLACIPAWYYILKRIVQQEKIYSRMPFFIMLYVIASPPFSISVQWASCMELFIANTSGLISGFILYNGFKNKNGRMTLSAISIAGSLGFGLISLFTYQNGFGCFFIPFILHLTAQRIITRKCWIAIGMALLIFLAYYLLFKYSIDINHIGASDRAGISIDPGSKLIFFFVRVLSSAFHFTFLFNEQNIMGLIIYAIIFTAWIIINIRRTPSQPIINKLFYLTTLMVILLIVYLPSLIVKEKYASNRTLFAIDCIVFILFFETVISVLSDKGRRITTSLFSWLFIINAWYNFKWQFLVPVKSEYAALRSFLENNYTPRISSIYFIRAEESAFKHKYGITSSWDEFGVPSSFFKWVPAFFSRQIVKEKTGNRTIAEHLDIRDWDNNEAFQLSKPVITDSVLVIDAMTLINAK